ncbi:enhanced intracellular survival protein Eis [Streptomyces sp. NPDC048172]|uniref:GNAT family N-acetyltransferase n=1 Tax=Streptomyces sp. NPDC048172 TaxID=3365505 RepID=UPI00371828D4
MTTTVPVTVREAADDAEFGRYLALAPHAFGKVPYDHGTLRAHGHAAVAARGNEVLGGGLFLPFAQHFGGRPVPSGGVAWLAVAPWERGAGLARRLTAYGTERLRDAHGAAVACAWTPAVGLYRRWGWEAVSVAASHTLSPAGLPPPEPGFTAVRPDPEECAALRRRLAPAWNGPLDRPHWWQGWRARVLTDPLTVGVTREGTLTGYATVTVEPYEPWGVAAVVHDLWHDGPDALPALLDAVTARSPQVREIRLRRAVLPSPGPLLWSLGQYTVREEGWYPWMLTLLDVPRALEARGWSPVPRGTVGLDVTSPDGRNTPYTLTFEEGRTRVRRGGDGTVRCTAGALAAWYAGALTVRQAYAYGTAAGDPHAADLLDALTTGQGPWLPETF